MALVTYNRETHSLNFNIPNPLDIFRRLTRPAAVKYDANWFVRFLKIAQEEDSAVQGVGEAYRTIAWANIAVTKLAQHCARADFQLFRGDTEITYGPIYNLFRDVNPYLSRYQLWEATVSWLFTRGECFWLYPPDAKSIPETFYLPDPNRMKEHLNKDGDITMWSLETDGDPIPYTPNTVVHFKLWNPWNRYRGVNPLLALDYEIAMDHHASSSNLAMLRNGSIPEGILTTDNPTMTEPQAKEIKDRWLKEHRGGNRAHSIAVLGAGTSYQQIQMSPHDMEYFQLKKWTREAIMAKYGVPLILAGANDDRSPLSGSDTRYQMRNFWEGTLIPILRFIEDKLETEFFARHSSDLIGQFDTSDIPELQEDMTERHTRDLANVTSGLKTINEVRDEYGLDPVPWGDVWWAPLSLSPVSDASEPSVDSTPIKTLFADDRRLPEVVPEAKGYTEAFKVAHWKRIARTWVRVEQGYRKELQEWMFGIRSHVLMLMASNKAPSATVMDEIMDGEYWAQADAELRRMSEKAFRAAALAVSPALLDLFNTIGVPTVSPSWTIFNTNAVTMLDKRLDKISQITETVREQTRDVLKGAIRDGITDQEAAQLMAEKFNMAKSRCRTIARTEIGGAINDSEIAAFIDQGFTEIEWLETKDGKARSFKNGDEFDHTDAYNNAGGPIKIGQTFPNGLMYPHDPSGEAGNTINCRCLALPVKESLS
uniref:Putative portal protein n=1 Tax=viral metagenome TaxID=1070528 RepID=A0A6M3IHP8_9ZZZZ